jgi:hypothetical protein
MSKPTYPFARLALIPQQAPHVQERLLDIKAIYRRPNIQVLLGLERLRHMSSGGLNQG